MKEYQNKKMDDKIKKIMIDIESNRDSWCIGVKNTMDYDLEYLKLFNDIKALVNSEVRDLEQIINQNKDNEG